eukprot:TRINITY_DN15092_c0_g1_i1.p1 TRINITY_DN15092_c0_g1~~TRINITY_DN15092_c0_g1_i1.p1  ORF type:complete len:361 (+),score=81.55 TRINITY_DN15092_c0_g1_i1:92-1084(+)
MWTEVILLALLFYVFYPRSKSHGLEVRRVESKDIDSVLFGELWILRKAYWPEDHKRTFIAFIKETKVTWITFRDVGDGSLRGAYTEEIVDGESNGQKFRAIYIGHLFFYTFYRGTPTMSLAFMGSFVRAWWNAPPGHRVFGVFSSISYKSYLLAAHTYPNMYPTRNNCDSLKFKTEKGVAQNVMSKLYPQYWTGSLISIPGIKLDVAPVDPAMLEENPDIKFFVERNPSHESGTALPCVFEITPHSLFMTVVTTAKRLVFYKTSNKSKGKSRSDRKHRARPKQRDLARTWTLPLETDISRTFNLEEKSKDNVKKFIGRLKKSHDVPVAST